MADTLDIKLFDNSGKEVGVKTVSSDIFGVRVRTGLIHEVIRWQRAKWRAGTHAVQTRAQVTGGGKKPWKQKGMGRARAGSNTSAIWVGGGIAHGPKVRSYEFSLNKKFKQKVLCGVLSDRLKEGRCMAVTSFGLSEIKTQGAVKVLANLGLNGKKAVVITGAEDAFLEKSIRNVAKVRPLNAIGVNTYDVVNSEYVLFTEHGLSEFQSRMSS